MNTRVHDPMQDIGYGRSGGSSLFAHFFDVRLLLLLAVVLLLLAAIARFQRTPSDHPDWIARRDMVRLLGAVLGGLAMEWVRSRFDLATPPFWIASAALLPFVIGVLVFGHRLFLAYRQSSGAVDPVLRRPGRP